MYILYISLNMKLNKATKRDLGHNNVVKRPHLDVWKTEFIHCCDYNEETIKRISKIIHKIEHKLERSEEFLKNNKDEISLSYYSEGYYNGRARAMEEIIDVFEEVLNEETNER